MYTVDSNGHPSPLTPTYNCSEYGTAREDDDDDGADDDN